MSGHKVHTQTMLEGAIQVATALNNVGRSAEATVVSLLGAIVVNLDEQLEMQRKQLAMSVHLDEKLQQICEHLEAGL